MRSPEAEVDILFFLILNGLVEKNDCIDHTGIHFYDRMMPVFDEMWNKVISGNWDGKKVMLAKEILFECSYPRLEEHFDIKTLRKGDSEIIDYYWNIAMMASKFYPDVELEMDSDDVENLINKLLRLSEECKEKDLWKIYWAVYMLMALADEKEMDIESCEALFQQLISKMLSSNYLESRVFAINWIFIDMNEGYSDDKYLIPDPQLISYLKHFDEELKISDSFVIFISHMKKVDGHKRSYKEKTPWNDVSRNPNYNYSLQRFSTFQKSIPINIKLNGHNFIIERTNKAIKKGTYAYEELIRMCNFNRNSIAYDSLYDYYHFITQFEWYMAYPKLLLDYYYKFPKLEIVFTKEKFLENAIGKESFKRFIFDHHLRPTISAEFLRDSELLQKVLDLYPETRLLLLHWFGYPANHCERIVRDASEKNLFRFLSGLQEFLYQNEPPDHLESLLEEIIQNTSNCIIRRAALNCLSHFPKNEVFQKYLLEEVEHIVSEQADNDCDEGSLKMMDPWPLYRVESRHSTHDYDDSSYIGKNIFYPHDEEDCVYHERVSLFVQLYRCYGKDFLKCLLDICSSQTGLKSVKTLMLACVKFWLEIMGYSSLYEDFKDIPEIAQFAHQCYRSGYGIFKDNWGIVMRKEGTEHFSCYLVPEGSWNYGRIIL